MNKDQINGHTNEVKGKVKEIVGKMTGEKNLEIKGTIQKSVGSVEAAVGDAKADLAKSIKNS